ncbi:uncharacterized protein AB9X84_014521 [Acanthopagrus schlegelii]
MGVLIDVWSHLTYNNKDNKTVCKPCGAKIAGKNTTNLKQKKTSDDKDDQGPTQQQAISTAFLSSSKYKTELKEQRTKEQAITR